MVDKAADNGAVEAFKSEVVSTSTILINSAMSEKNQETRLSLSDEQFHTPAPDELTSTILNPFQKMIIDSDSFEINAKNWYETQMLDYKPDIMEFMVNPNNNIFRYKWNAENWSEQFRHLEGAHDQTSSIKRHLLRVTVMLNTISVVKTHSYKIDDIQIDLKSDRLFTVVYNDQSKIACEQEISSMTPPFPLTTVQVINDDCLFVYKRLASSSSRPVLLNMADAETPGGGYREGYGGQEENLFRRSNYYLSLDPELDGTTQVQSFQCMSTSELMPMKAHQKMYPMSEFGAIHTSGITVFRDTEANGYDYVRHPMYDLCVIAMAAYPEPELTMGNTMLTNKFAVGMRKKIENLFAIAYKHGHDCLVLSALGCGAYMNPSEHVAAIFKSVIEQYAGYFKIIIFAIIDDQQTGNPINPNGNYQPFKDTLDGLQVHAVKHGHPTIKLDVVMNDPRVTGFSHIGAQMCVCFSSK